MKYRVEITDTQTGEMVPHKEHRSGFSRDEDCKFWWSEGNGSCDCNRELFFKLAKGEKDERPQTGFCLGGGRYHVRVTNEADEVIHEGISA